MEFKDYYRIMGVARDATQDEIKRVYRQLARKYHPDVSQAPDAEARFKELGEAYAVLKDLEKRAAYDQLGSDWQTGQDFRPPPDWNAGFEFSGGDYGANSGQNAADGGFSDFFEALYGRAGAARGRSPFTSRGEDHHAKVLIDLEDAYAGATRTITLQRPETGADGRVAMHRHQLNVTIPRGVHSGQHIRLYDSAQCSEGKVRRAFAGAQTGGEPGSRIHYRAKRAADWAGLLLIRGHDAPLVLSADPAFYLPQETS